MATGKRIPGRLRAVLGDEALIEDGVVHIVAAWRAPDGSLRVIRIGEGAPPSETDHFLLRAARMRADAIVTTGKILRDEPSLTHDELDPEFLAWRRNQLGRALPSQTAILTSGLGIDFAHPLLGRVPPPLLVLPQSNVKTAMAAATASNRDVEILGRERSSLRDTLAMLAERGLRLVLVEAGPSTASELYEPEPAVDELWLSVYEEPELANECVGGAFAEESRLSEIFNHSSAVCTRSETSGRWSFRRFWRA